MNKLNENKVTRFIGGLSLVKTNCLPLRLLYSIQIMKILEFKNNSGNSNSELLRVLKVLNFVCLCLFFEKSLYFVNLN